MEIGPLDRHVEAVCPWADRRRRFDVFPLVALLLVTGFPGLDFWNSMTAGLSRGCTFEW